MGAIEQMPVERSRLRHHRGRRLAGRHEVRADGGEDTVGRQDRAESRAREPPRRVQVVLRGEAPNAGAGGEDARRARGEGGRAEESSALAGAARRMARGAPRRVGSARELRRRRRVSRLGRLRRRRGGRASRISRVRDASCELGPSHVRVRGESGASSRAAVVARARVPVGRGRVFVRGSRELRDAAVAVERRAREYRERGDVRAGCARGLPGNASVVPREGVSVGFPHADRGGGRGAPRDFEVGDGKQMLVGGHHGKRLRNSVPDVRRGEARPPARSEMDSRGGMRRRRRVGLAVHLRGRRDGRSLARAEIRARGMQKGRRRGALGFLDAVQSGATRTPGGLRVGVRAEQGEVQPPPEREDSRAVWARGDSAIHRVEGARPELLEYVGE
mmetsp:Transcript_8705/g.31892  ORF Transcript_8705/g.31892 Transcript_8705/m.31892 type:complete len:390 (+) Transcript_8705:241-1410(+)